jgi:hypothetical protein
VIHEEGELLAFKLTTGHVDDRAPVPVLTRGLCGKLFDELYEKGVELITRLRKRALMDRVNGPLKPIAQLAHTPHRSPAHFLVNLVAGLIAYTYPPKKPSLHLRPDELARLPFLV